MIPKQVIEKAIGGGWMSGYNFTGIKERSLYVFVWEAGRPEVKKGEWKGYAVCLFRAEEIALDPSFWQALKPFDVTGYEPTGSYNHDGEKEYDLSWRVYAHRFYDLILTGGDTAKFWSELLPASNE